MNPVDKNYKAQLSFSDLDKSRKLSYQSTRIVNEKRKTGAEPFPSLAQRAGAHEGTNPSDMAIDMPKMKRCRE